MIKAIILTILFPFLLHSICFCQKKYEKEGNSFAGGISKKRNTNFNNLDKYPKAFKYNITIGLEDNDPNHLVNAFVVSYSFKKLLGEYIEDFKLIWWINDYYVVPGTNKRMNRSDLIEFPDLLNRYDYLTPLDIEFEINIEYQWGSGLKYFKPDLIVRSGYEGNLSIPDVKSWDEIFDIKNPKWADNAYSSELPSVSKNEKIAKIKEASSNNQLVFEWSEWVMATSVKIKQIDYPVNQMKSLFEDYTKRTSGKDALPSEQIAKEIEQRIKNRNKGGKPMTNKEALNFKPKDICDY